MKSPLHSPNPCSFCSYKIHKNNPLHFQHLRNPLVSADSKATSTPADSTLTGPLSLTPLQSTLTKNRGRGVAIDCLATFASPFRERRSTNPFFSTTCALFAHSFAQSGKSSAFFPMVCALFAKTWGVYPNYSLPRRLSARGQNGTRAILPHLYESNVTPTIDATPLTLSTRFSSLPLHTFSPSFGGRRVD